MLCGYGWKRAIAGKGLFYGAEVSMNFKRYACAFATCGMMIYEKEHTHQIISFGLPPRVYTGAINLGHMLINRHGFCGRKCPT